MPCIPPDPRSLSLANSLASVANKFLRRPDARNRRATAGNSCSVENGQQVERRASGVGAIKD